MLATSPLPISSAINARATFADQQSQLLARIFLDLFTKNIYEIHQQNISEIHQEKISEIHKKIFVFIHQKNIHMKFAKKYIFPSPLLNAHIHRHQCSQPSLTMISRENNKFPEADFFRRCHPPPRPPRPRRPTAGGGTVVSCRPPLYPRAGVINREYLL